MCILFASGESNIVSSALIAKKLSTKLKSDVSVLITQPFESLTNHPALQEIKRNKFNYVDFVGFYGKCNYKSVLENFGKNNKLKKLMEDFDEDDLLIITEIINSDPVIIDDLNGRFFNQNMKHQDVINYISLLVKFYNDVITEFQIEKILDLYVDNISKYILYLVSKKRKLKHLSLVHTRFKDYLILSETCGFFLGKELKKYKRLQTKSNLEKAKKALYKFKKQSDLRNKDEIKYLQQKSSFNLIQKIISLIGSIRFTLKLKKESSIKLKGLGNLSKGFKDCLDGGGSFNVIIYRLITFYRLLISEFRSQKIKTRNYPKKYFYYPFSYTSEGDSQFTSGSFLGDMTVLPFLRKFLPLDSFLIFKEHPAMTEERTFSEIEKIKKVPKSLYIPSNYKNGIINNPRYLLKNSIGNITVSGTSGLESILLEKPSLVLGEPYYREFFEMESYIKIGPILIKEFMMHPNLFKIKSEKSIEFISIITSQGVSLPYNSLLTMTLEKYKNNSISKNNINKIVSLFFKKLKK